jgi:16S rRNA (cytidine1402-2'-O)-methyltransferase
MPGALVLVATPIGNLEDMTLRGLRTLREVNLIAAEDTRHTGKLLMHFGITTPTVSLHEHNERSRIPELLERVRRGERVAIVTDAGMPAISDPGFAAVAGALAAGLKLEVIPGVSALTMAVAGAGLPTEALTFVGFPPSRAGERSRWLAGWRDIPGILVLFEAPHRLKATLNAMLQALGDRRVVVAHELTKIHESWHRGLISEVAADRALPTKGEFTILVSPAAQGASEKGKTAPASLGVEFGQLTNNDGMTRHDAIAELARRHGLRKRQVYSMVEAAKHSGE